MEHVFRLGYLQNLAKVEIRRKKQPIHWLLHLQKKIWQKKNPALVGHQKHGHYKAVSEEENVVPLLSFLQKLQLYCTSWLLLLSPMAPESKAPWLWNLGSFLFSSSAALHVPFSLILFDSKSHWSHAWTCALFPVTQVNHLPSLIQELGPCLFSFLMSPQVPERLLCSPRLRNLAFAAHRQ